MISSAAICCKPLNQRTLDELYKERTSWNQLIATLQGTGPAVAIAIRERNACTAMIWARLREIEGEESTLGKKLPDTNNLRRSA